MLKQPRFDLGGCRTRLTLRIKYKKKGEHLGRTWLKTRAKTSSLTREWITGFQRYPLLDLGEITQASLRGKRAGRLGSPAGPAVSSSTGGVTGQRNSETQLSVFICWFTGILWSSCMKSYYTCILRLLMMHFSTLFLNTSFQYLKIMCQTYASAVSLLSVYLGEKFTHSLMSQSLRALAALWCENCCFVLPFWSHGIITNNDYTPLLSTRGQRLEEFCLGKKGLQVLHWKVYVQDVPFADAIL